LRDAEVDDPSPFFVMLQLVPGAASSVVYLNPAPLHHAAALFWSAGVHNLGGTRVLVHSAAPCPPEVKEQVIEWLGPIVYEYYSGTEGTGITVISSEEWRAHR
jgi:acyl-CoA synthetase (AMP-forming)/AMP-acid ligase II